MPSEIRVVIAGAPSGVPGDLDHHVGTVDRGPQSSRLSDSAGGVVSQVRIDLDRYKAVAVVECFVGWEQDVRGIAHIFNCDAFEDDLRRTPVFCVFSETVVVNIAAGDCAVKDRRVGRDAS